MPYISRNPIDLGEYTNIQVIGQIVRQEEAQFTNAGYRSAHS
jgi:hypothetical protein